jgi:hypothetical protein
MKPGKLHLVGGIHGQGLRYKNSGLLHQIFLEINGQHFSTFLGQGPGQGHTELTQAYD